MQVKETKPEQSEGSQEPCQHPQRSEANSNAPSLSQHRDAFLHLAGRKFFCFLTDASLGFKSSSLSSLLCTMPEGEEWFGFFFQEANFQCLYAPSSPLGIYNNHTAPIEEGAEEESKGKWKRIRLGNKRNSTQEKTDLEHRRMH